jgi:hypothetical protein
MEVEGPTTPISSATGKHCPTMYAQALARHSTTDLTMNVYIHVAMADLATDVEGLPPVLDGAQKNAKPAVPADLASLAGNWESLPGNVRQAIVPLTRT